MEVAVGTGVGTRVGVGVGTGAGVAVGTDVGTGVAVGSGVGDCAVVGSGAGTGVAVGMRVGTGVAVGPGIGAAVAVGEGVLVGMTIFAGTEVLYGRGMGVGMGVATIVIVGTGAGLATGVSPAALPRVTNTAPKVTAATIRSPRATGMTGNERRGETSWCCLTSPSSEFSRRKNTEPSLSKRVTIIANIIHPPPIGTSQAGHNDHAHQPHQSPPV